MLKTITGPAQRIGPLSNDQELAHSLSSGGLIRLLSSLISISLVAASIIVVIESREYNQPLLQMPAAIITLLLAPLALYASSHALTGHRFLASTYWSICVILLVSMPFLEVLPVRYETETLLILKTIAPPIWPYSIAIPLLVFLIFEISIPMKKPNVTSSYFVLISLIAPAMLLFFSNALLSEITNNSSLILDFQLLALAFTIPIGLSALMAIASVLSRRHMAAFGIMLLLLTGLSIEWISTWSYDGPHFLSSAARMWFPGFPLLPVLAGTIPGILASLAAMLAARETYLKPKDYVLSETAEADVRSLQ